MSCFLLSKGLCEKIERVVYSFWWGSNDNKRKIHWCKKENLFKSKFEGGMGFKILRGFNLAMLAKQAWRFHTSHNSLISRNLWVPIQAMLEGAFSMLFGSFIRGLAGELAMVRM